MMRPNDPRIRQTINQISQNIEFANETAQVGIYNFSRNFIQPCFASLSSCLGSCCATSCSCSPGDLLQRRRRGRSLARVERNFGFYDDWDYDEDARDTIFGWGGDELDRLLAGSGSRTSQPGRHRRMSYGAARSGRKNMEVHGDETQDPTLIPTSSVLGFLDRLPWRLGSRGINTSPHRNGRGEEEPLLGDSDDESDHGPSDMRSPRHRSSTQSSQGTTNSLSSRGDLIPSDEEQADAIPLDDSFALALDRRNTGLTFDSLSNATSTRHSASDLSLATQESSDRSKPHQQPARSVKRSGSPLFDGTMSSVEHITNDEEGAAAKNELNINKTRKAAQRQPRHKALNEPEESVTPNDDSAAFDLVGTHGSRPATNRSLSSVSTEPFPPPVPEPLDYDEDRV
ncbi:hypothetical protein KEM56_001162 [Ascosphaera pollenicola]|nr:hypothetical protein KEM56_001162 [Ascosphaera pollenicola]